jgi:hypothetical protein
MPRKPSTRLTVSLAGFQRAVEAIAKAKNSFLPLELNRQMLKVLVGAPGVKGLVHLTLRALESDIRADMARVVTYSIRGGTPITARLSRVLAAQALYRQGGHITRAALEVMEKKIIDARVRSRAYMAASWLFSAFDLAKTVPGNTLNRQDNIPMTTQARKNKASDADSIPATASRLKVTAFNTARGASKVATRPIPTALNNARLDMIKYLGKKFAKAVQAERR